ncbi:hypothetical protein GO986_21885 [Deinococcus sp. HMF7620]|uniref:Uncharacterized protein n=1 Tax=Deinococcus arboris TaxID=2682977 RepID=A0A7C9HUH3_9DEIO|nr:hypothetical protein [Deinococcus arboris]MVN89389.1 hypothetical protein [Deinococcus arboris]
MKREGLDAYAVVVDHLPCGEYLVYLEGTSSLWYLSADALRRARPAPEPMSHDELVDEVAVRR